LTVFESAKKKITNARNKSKARRDNFNKRLNEGDKGTEQQDPENLDGVPKSTKSKLATKVSNIKTKILFTLTTVVAFFEFLPVFLTVILWLLIILCLFVLIIVILSLLSVPELVVDKPVDFVRDDSTDVVAACSYGGLAWTADELSTRGGLFSPYEKALYTMGIFAKQTIEGYGYKELGADSGVDKSLRVKMLLGKASIESSMTFYEDRTVADDIRERNTLKGINSSGYGFMGICGNNDPTLIAPSGNQACYPAKTIALYYTDPAWVKIIQGAYTPSKTPSYQAQFAPWGVAMSGKHFMGNLEEVSSVGWMKKVDTIANEWGIVANKKEFVDMSALFLAQLRYHSGVRYDSDIKEVDGYINFFAALFTATSDTDSARSFSKWSTSPDPDLSYGESELRRMILGSGGKNSLDGVATPSELKFSSGSTPILLNGVVITKPVWSVLWDKHKDKQGMKLAWAVAQSVSSTGGDRALNFHYGFNSMVQADKIIAVLNSKLLGGSSCGDSEVGSKIAKAGVKYIGIPYKQVNDDFSIITPGKYENGVNIVGVFKGFLDCSLFTQTIFKEYGYDLLRRAIWQHDFEGQTLITTEFDTSKMKPGDLIYFWGTTDDLVTLVNSYADPRKAPIAVKAKNITHVGVYYGDGLMIHSGESKGVVVTALTDSYWGKYFADVKRLNY
jgi:cell wall-associated NlpC family hydrolase